RFNELNDPKIIGIIQGIIRRLNLEAGWKPYLLMVSSHGVSPHVDNRPNPSIECSLNIPASDLSESTIQYYAEGDTKEDYGEPQFSYCYRRPTIVRTQILHCASAGTQERYNFRVPLKGRYDEIRDQLLSTFSD
ncbi:MAG: hypothetical protein AAGF35_03320, partial [Pseudomonadota bacterium]